MGEVGIVCAEEEAVCGGESALLRRPSGQERSSQCDRQDRVVFLGRRIVGPHVDLLPQGEAVVHATGRFERRAGDVVKHHISDLSGVPG